MGLDRYSEEHTLISNFLSEQTGRFSPEHPFQEVYRYALLPAGKLFRPLLALISGTDFGATGQEDMNKILLFATALEVHHTYTLIHDDLPCMDDDDFRRGRPSTHKKFNEWSAVLAGDGLLGASYRLLLQIKHERTRELASIFSWATGPKGLIQGQVLDLSLEGQKNFDELLTTHKLKTSRLIQLSLLGPALLFSKNADIWNAGKNAWRMGESLGLLFQFLDDLSELTEEDPGAHELDINPWLHHKEKTLSLVKQHTSRLHKTLDKHPGKELPGLIAGYFGTMENKIKKGAKNVRAHLKDDHILDQLFPIVM